MIDGELVVRAAGRQLDAADGRHRLLPGRAGGSASDVERLRRAGAVRDGVGRDRGPCVRCDPARTATRCTSRGRGSSRSCRSTCRWNTGSASREPLRPRAEDGRRRPGRVPHVVSPSRAGARRRADRVQRLRDAAGAERLPVPLREHGEEEWIVVLTGRPTVRTPEGERELGPWDCVFCPAGEAGAHKVTNHGDEPARILIWSNRSTPGTTIVSRFEQGRRVAAGEAVPARRRRRLLRRRGRARNRSRRAARCDGRARVGALAVSGEVDARRTGRGCRHSQATGSSATGSCTCASRRVAWRRRGSVPGCSGLRGRWARTASRSSTAFPGRSRPCSIGCGR